MSSRRRKPQEEVSLFLQQRTEERTPHFLNFKTVREIRTTRTSVSIKTAGKSTHVALIDTRG